LLRRSRHTVCRRLRSRQNDRCGPHCILGRNMDLQLSFSVHDSLVSKISYGPPSSPTASSGPQTLGRCVGRAATIATTQGPFFFKTRRGAVPRFAKGAVAPQGTTMSADNIFFIISIVTLLLIVGWYGLGRWY